MIVGPPAAPIASTGRSPSKTSVGDMLESGRLPGAGRFASAPTNPNAFGAPASAAKSSISLFSTTPMPGTTTLEPYEVLMVDVQETQLPAASAAEKCVVCFSNTCSSARGGVPWSLTSVALATSIFAARLWP